MRSMWLGALLALAGSMATQGAQAQAPKGKPEAGGVLKDTEFGVTTRQFALQRRVEMFQWQRDGGGYGKVWSEAPIASSGFDADHRNPGRFPMQARFWVSTEVSLDGKPVHEDVLKQFGRWHGFRPGFSALPGNLAATFQPEGDGLSSAENPLAPQIGDLRVTWREMRLPDLAGKVVLQQGRWLPADDNVVADSGLEPDPGLRTATTNGGTKVGYGVSRAWLAAVAGALVLLLLLFARRRRRGR